MSNSTIFIKTPLNYRESLALLKKKCGEYWPQMSIMCTLSGLYSAVESNFNTNISGESLSLSVYSLLLILVSSILFLKGLRSKSIPLILPWVGLSLYTLYFHQYVGLINTLTTLKKVKKLSWLPWTKLITNILLLITHGTLTIRTIQLCAHIWFKKKINEMKEKPF